jgi:Ca-activated chloride channel family protein
MTKIDLSLLPLRPALAANTRNTLDVLLRATAPTTADSGLVRPSLNLAFVIDRSGSMAGRPLEEAKRCVAMMIDNLRPTDRACLIAYDDEVSVLMPSRPVVEKSELNAILRRLESGGSTNLHAGWLKGAELAARAAGDLVLSRVLLLSDGQANVGLEDPDQIARHCAEMACAGVTTSTYGLAEQFNEDLMMAMARAGRGSGYYGRTANDLMEPFQREFDLLTALCGRSLRLKLQPTEGVELEVLNRYSRDGDGRFILPDIAYASEAWALLRLTIPSHIVNAHVADPLQLLTATLNYADLSGRQISSEPITLSLPCLAADAVTTMEPDALVVRRRVEIRCADLQEEARHAARDHDWPKVGLLLRQLREESRGNQWLSASIEELERYARRRETESFAKESLYKSGTMRNRLASAQESAAWSNLSDSDLPSYLRRKREEGRGSPV